MPIRQEVTDAALCVGRRLETSPGQKSSPSVSPEASESPVQVVSWPILYGIPIWKLFCGFILIEEGLGKSWK